MMAESRESISQVSETPVIDGMYHFAAAIGWGTLTGTAALGLGFMVFAEVGVGLAEIFGGLLFLFAFVGPFTLAGFIVIGLPTTLMLCAIGREYASLYAGVGAIAGFLVFGIPPDIESLHLFPISGALAGLACAWRWGKWREQVARARQQAPKRQAAEKRNNPIHDLIH